MAPQEPIPATLGERVVGALAGTAVIAYLAFLVLDIMNGWGLGWVVLGWAALGLGAVAAVVIFIALWVWVWRGTGRYQMKDGR